MDVNLNSITGIPYSTNYLTNLGTNPTVLLVITVIIILYYVLFASLGVAKGQPIGETVSNSAQGIVMLEVLLWGVFVVLLLLNGMSYIFNIDIGFCYLPYQANVVVIEILCNSSKSERIKIKHQHFIKVFGTSVINRQPLFSVLTKFPKTIEQIIRSLLKNTVTLLIDRVPVFSFELED